MRGNADARGKIKESRLVIENDFRRRLAVLVLEAAVSACRGEDVRALNAELAKRWRIVAEGERVKR
jgi:hypothetical protein